MKCVLEDADEIVWQHGDREEVDENLAAAVLLSEGVLFVNCRDITLHGKPEGTTAVLFVNCNDVFMWACADGEYITPSEIGELYLMTRRHKHGLWRWVCIRRNMQPQAAVERLMRADGQWDDVMESLPANPWSTRSSGNPPNASQGQ